MKLVVGLGNPGPQYQQTLHNAGALVLDELATGWTHAPQNIAADISKGPEVVYAKPTTFMNTSGTPVQLLLNYYKISPDDLILVHDDIDLRMGEVKTESGRGAGGHNGVSSVIQALGRNKQFTRIRIGVATHRTAQREGKKRNVAKVVLKKPGFFERGAFKKAIASGAEAVRRAI